MSSSRFAVSPFVYLILSSVDIQSASAAVLVNMTDAVGGSSDSGNLTTDDGDVFRLTRDGGGAGTGLISPFLNIQNNTGEEEGFNHDGTSKILDETVSQTKSLQISDVPIVTHNGQNYREFLLDLNEPGSGGGSLVSLNQIQLFAATEAVGTSPSLINSGAGVESGVPYIEFSNATEIFRLSDIIAQYEILMDAELAGNGSGTFNMRLLIETSLFSGLGATSTHLIFYSQFGEPPGSAAATSGFEEWSVRTSAVPEPSAILLLGICGLGGCWRARRRRSVQSGASAAA